jgi:hypothetical protein
VGTEGRWAVVRSICRLGTAAWYRTIVNSSDTASDSGEVHMPRVTCRARRSPEGTGGRWAAVRSVHRSGTAAWYRTIVDSTVILHPTQVKRTCLESPAVHVQVQKAQGVAGLQCAAPIGQVQPLHAHAQEAKGECPILQ